MTEAIADTERVRAARGGRRASEPSRRRAVGPAAHLLEGAPRRAALDSLESGWFALRIDFDRLGGVLEARAQRREADLATLVALAESWTASRGLAREDSAPAAVLERVDATLAAIAATRMAVERRRDRVLVLQDTVSRARQAAQDSLLRIASARHDAVQRALSSRERPIWQALREGRLSGVRRSGAARAAARRMARSAARVHQGARRQLRRHTRPLAAAHVVARTRSARRFRSRAHFCSLCC